jgi:hypothetical protein
LDFIGFMYDDVDITALPKSVDWRNQSAVTNVKNQMMVSGLDGRGDVLDGRGDVLDGRGDVLQLLNRWCPAEYFTALGQQSQWVAGGVLHSIPVLYSNLLGVITTAGCDDYHPRIPAPGGREVAHGS